MSTEPSDFMASKRDRGHINAEIGELREEIRQLRAQMEKRIFVPSGIVPEAFYEQVKRLFQRVTLTEEAIVAFAEEIVDLQERVAHHHIPGQMAILPSRVTPKQREALAYMAAHADLRLPPIVWQENGGFGGSILPKLVEHGLVDRIAGNRYRINEQGLAYVSTPS